QAIVGGEVALEELAEAWNARMQEYLGIEVPNDAQGVLQDVHWSFGGFGYFPTYSLGNVVSVQLWEKVREAIPDLDDQIEAGGFSALRDWLGEKPPPDGPKVPPPETPERNRGGAPGAPPDNPLPQST